MVVLSTRICVLFISVVRLLLKQNAAWVQNTLKVIWEILFA